MKIFINDVSHITGLTFFLIIIFMSYLVILLFNIL